MVPHRSVPTYEELLGGLGRMARIAPELAGLLDDEVPDRTTLDGA